MIKRFWANRKNRKGVFKKVMASVVALSSLVGSQVCNAELTEEQKKVVRETTRCSVYPPIFPSENCRPRRMTWEEIASAGYDDFPFTTIYPLVDTIWAACDHSEVDFNSFCQDLFLTNNTEKPVWTSNGSKYFYKSLFGTSDAAVNLRSAFLEFMHTVVAYKCSVTDMPERKNIITETDNMVFLMPSYNTTYKRGVIGVWFRSNLKAKDENRMKYVLNLLRVASDYCLNKSAPMTIVQLVEAAKTKQNNLNSPGLAIVNDGLKTAFGLIPVLQNDLHLDLNSPSWPNALSTCFYIDMIDHSNDDYKCLGCMGRLAGAPQC